MLNATRGFIEICRSGPCPRFSLRWFTGPRPSRFSGGEYRGQGPLLLHQANSQVEGSRLVGQSVACPTPQSRHCKIYVGHGIKPPFRYSERPPVVDGNQCPKISPSVSAERIRSDQRRICSSSACCSMSSVGGGSSPNFVSSRRFRS